MPYMLSFPDSFLMFVSTSMSALWVKLELSAASVPNGRCTIKRVLSAGAHPEITRGQSIAVCGFSCQIYLPCFLYRPPHSSSLDGEKFTPSLLSSPNAISSWSLPQVLLGHWALTSPSVVWPSIYRMMSFIQAFGATDIPRIRTCSVHSTHYHIKKF